MATEERVALVLGAVKGIGREIGISLARRGIRTVLTWHDWEESHAEMKGAFESVGVDHEIVRVDLTDTAAIEGLLDTVIRRFGRLDILINNIERGGDAGGPWRLHAQSVGARSGHHADRQALGVRGGIAPPEKITGWLRGQPLIHCRYRGA